jgi:lysine-specific demethylase 8
MSGHPQQTQPYFEAIPNLALSDWGRLSHAQRVSAAILKSVMPEAAKLTPGLIAENYYKQEVMVTVDLPKTGVPYSIVGSGHYKRIRISQIVDMLESGVDCYLNQASVCSFADLDSILDFSPLNVSEFDQMNLWMGRGTKSGLHFDFADNLFLQTYGTKWVVLAPPTASRYLYPFSDVPHKSQIDPETPDLKAFPLFARCKLYAATLEPGDVLFIPKGWWHYLRADNVSISVNCWYGELMSTKQCRRQYLAGGGTKVIFRWLRDFCYFGLLQRPYQRRLFSPACLGVQSYDRLRRHFSAGNS